MERRSQGCLFIWRVRPVILPECLWVFLLGVCGGAGLVICVVNVVRIGLRGTKQCA